MGQSTGSPSAVCPLFSGGWLLGLTHESCCAWCSVRRAAEVRGADRVPVTLEGGILGPLRWAGVGITEQWELVQGVMSSLGLRAGGFLVSQGDECAL